MKKNYITPKVAIAQIETECILAGSDPTLSGNQATTGGDPTQNPYGDGLAKRGTIDWDE